MPFAVRALELREIPMLIELLKTCGVYYADADSPEKLAAKLQNDGNRGLMIGAFDDTDQLVGFVMASFDGWAAVVWHYCVHPHARKGTGLALLLGRTIVRRLKELGADRVYALVESKNRPMFRFAKAAGFDVDGGTSVVVIERRM